MRYCRVPRLTDELLRAGAQQKKSAFFKLLAKADLLVLDLCVADSNVELASSWPTRAHCLSLCTPHN